MILSLLYLASALSISGIAAYFSVLGLATIFPGSMVPIIIMGGVLESGKIIAAIWLHRNWKTAPILIRSYLTFAVLVLMGITSMGIFGFLSRAHIEHQTTTEKALAMVETIDNKIIREKDYIERQRQYIESLEDRTDKSTSSTRVDIDQENSRIKDITEQMNKDIFFEQERVDKSNEELNKLNKELESLEASSGGIFSNKKKKAEELKARQVAPREKLALDISSYNNNIDNFRSQAKAEIQSIIDKISNFRDKTSTKDTSIQPQIDVHSENIADSHGKIDELEAEKLGLSNNARSLEAEVGPVKYVAEGIADITGREFEIAQAVRIVIFILVLVFDPLAILLVIAANISIAKNFPTSNKAHKKFVKQSEKLEESKSRLKQEESNVEGRLAKLKRSEEKANGEALAIEGRIKTLNEALKKKRNEEELLSQVSNAAVKDLEECILEKDREVSRLNEKIKEKKKQMEEQVLRLKKIEDEAHSMEEANSELKEETKKHAKLIKQDEQELFQKEAELSAAKAIVTARGAKVQSEQEKYDFRIKNLEEILSHLAKEKEKAAKEKCELEEQSSALKGQIETQKELIKNLNQTYSDASRSEDINGIFNKHEINETVKFLADGQHLVSIQGAKGRVHQFVVPQQHLNLSHTYYHKVATILDQVVDEDDLPHEYLKQIAKFVRIKPPKYNCLT
jgi:chromosome segregation ATPase